MSAQVQERNRTRRSAPFLVLGAAVVVAIVIAVVAGGGGGGSNSGSAAATGANDGLAKARAVAEKATTRPTSLGLTTPIGKPVPAGKKVAFISCGVEACQIQGDIIKQGASDLGWTASTISTDGSPEQLQNAFNSALRQGADAVIINAVNRAAVAKQIQEAKQKGVAFVTSASVEKTGDGILANIADTSNSAKIGEKLAAQIVADSGAKANTLYVNISAFQILKALGDQFQSSYKGYCPSCKYASLDIPATSLGKDAPDRIVSYLRSHPQVNYAVLSVSNALGAGLPAALRAAGLSDKVKIVGQSGDTQTYKDLQAKNLNSVVPYDYYAVDYLMLDALARHFAGVRQQHAYPPLWITTPENMPAEATKGLFPVDVNYRDEFKKLWGKQ
jgi:ABC-type sugar transport system substrate-binding protein